MIWIIIGCVLAGIIGIFGVLSLLFLLMSEDRKRECCNCLYYDAQVGACTNGCYTKMEKCDKCRKFRRGVWRAQ